MVNSESIAHWEMKFMYTEILFSKLAPGWDISITSAIIKTRGSDVQKFLVWKSEPLFCFLHENQYFQQSSL